MAKYTKKPFVIDAVQFGASDFLNWEPWVQEAYDQRQWSYSIDPATLIPNGFVVKTLEGDMKANPGDYLIKGVKGELYPCREDIFKMTYDKVGD